MRTPSLYSQDDPISAALKPPPTETDSERKVRLQREHDARRISEAIDDRLKEERERLKASKGDIKLLLLGQAESGKSTLQKQFQLMYKPHSLEEERISWRTVIYFNVVHSIKHILATLEAWDDSIDDEISDANDTTSPSSAISTDRTSSPTAVADSKSSNTLTGSPVSSTLSRAQESKAYQIATLRQRLSPLIAADKQLAERLSGGVSVSGSGKGGVYVRSGWQARAIENAMGKGKPRRNASNGAEAKLGRESISKEGDDDALMRDVGKMMDALKDDIKTLWSHPTVRGMIAKRRLKLDEWSEFFLSHITRVVAPEYIPTTDDILHARIQTMGISEHVFDVIMHGKPVVWHLYDVGGARGQRHSWVPYFDDANAIIFVAPVSAFDQYLEEDPRTNRIDDSLQLFTQICSNVLLKSVHLVLFLNKTDLLKAKLASGLRVQKYITSFGDRTNDYETVIQYFRAHFLQVHRRNNESRRVLYTHFTSVVDTKATQRIIGNVRDSIFRGYLQSAALV